MGPSAAVEHQSPASGRGACAALRAMLRPRRRSHVVLPHRHAAAPSRQPTTQLGRLCACRPSTVSYRKYCRPAHNRPPPAPILPLSCPPAAAAAARVEYTEEDPKPQLEEACRVECIKEWHNYKVGAPGGGVPLFCPHDRALWGVGGARWVARGSAFTLGMPASSSLRRPPHGGRSCMPARERVSTRLPPPPARRRRAPTESSPTPPARRTARAGPSTTGNASTNA